MAQKYPEAAVALHMDESGIQDPDLRRLIEAFALIDAKISLNNEKHKTFFSEFLLGVFMPEILAASPSSTVIELSYSSLTKNIVIPKRSRLSIGNSQELTCTFTTTTSHKIVQAKIIDIRLIANKIATEKPFSNFIYCKIQITDFIDKLKLYINHDLDISAKIFQAILTAEKEKHVDFYDYNSGEKVGQIRFCEDSSSSVNFNLIGYPYKAIYDYSINSRQFYFFELNFLRPQQSGIEILLPLNNNIALSEITFNERTLLTNCIPVVNLFEHKSEPAKIEPGEDFCILRPAQNTDDNLKIYKIAKLYTYNLLYELKYHYIGKDYFVYAEPEIETALHIYLYNKFGLSLLDNSTSIYADLLCTNKVGLSNIDIHSEINLIDFQHIETRLLHLPNKSQTFHNSTNWSFIKQILTNQFDTYQKADNLMSLVSQILELYNLPATIFKQIFAKSDLAIISNQNAFRTVVTVDLFQITLNQNHNISFVLAVIWAQIFIDCGHLGTLTKVEIVSEGGEILKIVSNINE